MKTLGIAALIMCVLTSAAFGGPGDAKGLAEAMVGDAIKIAGFGNPEAEAMNFYMLCKQITKLAKLAGASTEDITKLECLSFSLWNWLTAGGDFDEMKDFMQQASGCNEAKLGHK